MTVKVSGFKADRKEEVISAADSEWDFDDWIGTTEKDATETLTATGHGNLCGGETEAEFAKRLSRAAFKANGGPCEVEVNATCLDELPCETYSFDENDYEDYVKEQQSENADGGNEEDANKAL
jgi:hypothetical protein